MGGSSAKWDFSKDAEGEYSSDPCDLYNPWYGVKCNSLMTDIVSLNLHETGMSGRLPSTLGGLSGLTYLDLSRNDLFGQVPISISTGMLSLKIMNLYSNRLQGALDLGFFSKLTKLEVVNVYNNNLVGFVPDSLGSVPNLELLFMDRNRLSGYVSAAPGALSNLEKLGILQVSEGLKEAILGVVGG